MTALRRSLRQSAPEIVPLPPLGTAPMLPLRWRIVEPEAGEEGGPQARVVDACGVLAEKLSCSFVLTLRNRIADLTAGSGEEAERRRIAARKRIQGSGGLHHGCAIVRVARDGNAQQQKQPVSDVAIEILDPLEVRTHLVHSTATRSSRKARVNRRSPYRNSIKTKVVRWPRTSRFMRRCLAPVRVPDANRRRQAARLYEIPITSSPPPSRKPMR